MSLQIETFVLGPIENNTFLLSDAGSGTCAVVDPSFGAEEVWGVIQQRGWKLSSLLITHAHFDHIGGVNALLDEEPEAELLLHPDGLALLQAGGGAREFGFAFDPPRRDPKPLYHGQELLLGASRVQVRSTPGHAPGHVIFYLPGEKTALVGDLIFRRGVGRTDLPGGSGRVLIESIREQVLTLPGETMLLPGHGPGTTVADERAENPYLQNT